MPGCNTKNFDVFLSFRGEDTRNGFTDHLFAALQRKGIVAFRDNQKINKGQFIAPELEQAIEGSRVFIVVFSKNYAFSTWCLQELSKIVDWVKVTGQSVLPVFYDIAPSEVRKQSGNSAKAFAEHEQRFKDDLEMVKKWREALKAVTNRCGWDVQNKPQNEEIEKIVEEVSDILGRNQIFKFGNDLVDMQSRVEGMEELMDLGSNEVRVVGICGMGGIGKTTLATSLFEKISHQFDACCFIDDVSKIYRNFGPTVAQKQLLCQALNHGNMGINNIFQGTMLVRTTLCHLKVLIVLDNVDHVEQLEKLGLSPEYLGAGSRIIIVSRDGHILRSHGVNEVYSVQLLHTDEALQLFCKKAFKSDDIVKDYESLTYQSLEYANGLPLAIKALGSFLFDREISEWRSALARLKENPSKDVLDVLRISFDGLDETEKEIFLDIACFFSGEDETEVKKLLDYRGFYTEIGIRVLVDKSLITIEDGWRNRSIYMHDMLRELGRSIVREKSPKEPRKWSRLWHYKDLYKVMLENKEADNLEVIVVENIPESNLVPTWADALSKMNHLKLLRLRNVNFSGNIDYLSKELRYLSWEKYPFICLPSSFHPNKLVEMILPYSSMKQLWQGIKDLPNLKIIDISNSKYLVEMPDLSGAPHLKKLILQGCEEMMRIDPSISMLKELVLLDLKNCKNLVLNLNTILGLSSLEILNISGCLKLFSNYDLEKLETNKSAIQFLTPSSICKFLMLPFHFPSSLQNQQHSIILGSNLSRLLHLRFLDLSFCNLLQIPDVIGILHSLEYLDLAGNKFVTLPNSIKELSKLYYLNFQHCKQLKYLPVLPSPKPINSAWSSLYIFDCPKLTEMERCYSLVFSWMIKNFEAYMQSPLYKGIIVLVIPGTQIPRWFTEQTVGDSISLNPSSILKDPNWIGVAYCAVFVARDDPTNSWDIKDPYLYFGVMGSGRYYCASTLLKKDLVTVESDHLMIFFLSREEFINTYARQYAILMHGLDKVDLETMVQNNSRGLCIKVKNCGYRWVFKEDIEQLNPNTMFSENSSCRKRKFLTSE